MVQAGPMCYRCVHRRTVPGNCHSRCNNLSARAQGSPMGIAHGWFYWPVNFDPCWVVHCDGFSDRPEDDLPEQRLDPLQELLSYFCRRFDRG